MTLTEDVKKTLIEKAKKIAACVWNNEQSGKITFTVHDYTIVLEQQYHPYSFNNTTAATYITVDISWTDKYRTVIDRSSIEEPKYYNDRPIKV